MNAIIENLIKLIDLIVIYPEDNDFYKGELALVETNPAHFFENDNYRYEYRPLLEKEKVEDLAKFVFYDSLIGSHYFVPLKNIKDKEVLWHWLSVFVGKYDLNYLRQKITDTIYDDNYYFDLIKASVIFEDSGYCLCYLMLEEKCIGLIEESKIDRIAEIGKDIGIEFKKVV